MRQAREILGRAMRRLGRPEQRLEWLAAVWPVIVGKRLAERTRPIALNDRVLEIGVAGDDWHEQLREMTGMLRREINVWWGSELVRQIKLTREALGSAGRKTKPPVRFEMSEEHIPFIRRGAQRRKVK